MGYRGFLRIRGARTVTRPALIGGGGNGGSGGSADTTYVPSWLVSYLTTLPNPPSLPIAVPDITMPTLSGNTITVLAGGDLQAAFNAARPGDTIVLDSTGTWVGEYTIPATSGSDWIIVKTSSASIPPAGTRITPAYANALPKILTNVNATVPLTFADGAKKWRFIGIEFSVTNTVSLSYNIIECGRTNATSVNDLPENIIFDRVYVHGNDTGNIRRGIAFNPRNSAIIESYLSNFHEQGADNQAFACWNGPGPYLIRNSYLEAAGENVLFGGADPAITNLVPSDITFIKNHCYKPQTWNPSSGSFVPLPGGGHWTCKNIFELKNAKRTFIYGNVFENHWVDAQPNGFSVLFTPRNQDRTAPWSGVTDVTYACNWLTNVPCGINMLGADDLATAVELDRIVVVHSLFTQIDGSSFGSSYSRVFMMLRGPKNIVIEHNTMHNLGDTMGGAVIVFSPPMAEGGRRMTGFIYRNNIGFMANYGFGGDATYGNINLTFSEYLTSPVFVKNLTINAETAWFPVNNFGEMDIANVGFASTSGSNWSLSATSPYHNAGSDGLDLGYHYTRFRTATGL